MTNRDKIALAIHNARFAHPKYPREPDPFTDRGDIEYAYRLTDAALAIIGLKPMSSAPKDRPILAYCDHEADPYHEGDRLTLYAAHYEGMDHAPTGFHIIEWGGAFDDSSHEEPNAAHLPDWWFVVGSEFEKAANPIAWTDLPEVPKKEK